MQQRRLLCLLVLISTASSACIRSVDFDDDSAGPSKPDPKLRELGNDVAGVWGGTIAEASFRLELKPGPDASRGQFELECLATGCEKTLPGVNALITTFFPRAGSYRLNSPVLDGKVVCSLNPLGDLFLDGGDLSSFQPGGTLARFGLDADGTRLEFSMSVPFGTTQSWPATFLRASDASEDETARE